MDLLIHVGLHKTGTTSVQDQLHRNRECLLGEGILYPTTGLFGSQHGLIPGSIIPRHFFLDRTPRSLCTRDYLEELSREVEGARPNLVILSSEVFTEIAHNRPACLGMLDELRRGFESCSLLLTTRNPQELALSALKHSARERIEPWVQDPLGSYIKAFNSVRSLQSFWETCGFPIYLKSLDDDTTGNLTDFYFGEIIADYSQRARECLAPANSEQAANSRQKLNSDRLDASTYAILFLIGNTEKSHLFAKRPIFSMISKLVNSDKATKSSLDSICTPHLIGYLEHFRLTGSPNTDARIGPISIEDKLAALGLAKVPNSAIETLASIAAEIMSST